MARRNHDAVEVSISQMRVLGDKVMVTDMDFDARVTASGLILPNDDMEQRGIRPRWCRIIAKGPKQEDVEVGEWIYVAHGRWTRGVDVLDTDTDTHMTIRLVDPKDMILRSPEPLRDETVREKLGLDGGV
jgi:co-chaperonin GroES (HSP10)